MGLAIKSAAAVKCYVLGMHACGKAVTVLVWFKVKIMRQQDTLLAPFVNGYSNTSDKRCEKQKQYNFHALKLIPEAAFFKTGAISC
jgi:hypothetical protein